MIRTQVNGRRHFGQPESALKIVIEYEIQNATKAAAASSAGLAPSNAGSNWMVSGGRWVCASRAAKAWLSVSIMIEPAEVSDCMS